MVCELTAFLNMQECAPFWNLGTKSRRGWDLESTALVDFILNIWEYLSWRARANSCRHTGCFDQRLRRSVISQIHLAATQGNNI